MFKLGYREILRKIEEDILSKKIRGGFCYEKDYFTNSGWLFHYFSFLRSSFCSL
jgi:hypothetical protein